MKNLKCTFCKKYGHIDKCCNKCLRMLRDKERKKQQNVNYGKPENKRQNMQPPVQRGYDDSSSEDDYNPNKKKTLTYHDFNKMKYEN